MFRKGDNPGSTTSRVDNSELLTAEDWNCWTFCFYDKELNVVLCVVSVMHLS